MDIINFKDYAELGNHIYEISNNFEAVSVVLFKREMEELLRWLLEYEDITIGDIHISEDYAKEYYITLDEYMFLTIRPCFNNEGKVIKENVDIMLFDGDVSNNIALTNSECTQYEIVYMRKDKEHKDYNYSQRVNEALESAMSMVDFIKRKYKF